MKTYRCIFTYSRGSMTISVTANDAESAANEAQLTVDEALLEIWDETGLVLTRDLRRGPYSK